MDKKTDNEKQNEERLKLLFRKHIVPTWHSRTSWCKKMQVNAGNFYMWLYRDLSSPASATAAKIALYENYCSKNGQCLPYHNYLSLMFLQECDFCTGFCGDFDQGADIVVVKCDENLKHGRVHHVACLAKFAVLFPNMAGTCFVCRQQGSNHAEVLKSLPEMLCVIVDQTQLLLLTGIGIMCDDDASKEEDIEQERSNLGIEKCHVENLYDILDEAQPTADAGRKLLLSLTSWAEKMSNGHMSQSDIALEFSKEFLLMEPADWRYEAMQDALVFVWGGPGNKTFPNLITNQLDSQIEQFKKDFKKVLGD